MIQRRLARPLCKDDTQICEVFHIFVNIQKSVAFLFTNSELSERKIKKTIPLTIASRRIKYLGIKLTKTIRDLYSENYQTLMKEIEDDTNK